MSGPGPFAGGSGRPQTVNFGRSFINLHFQNPGQYTLNLNGNEIFGSGSGQRMYDPRGYPQQNQNQFWSNGNAAAGAGWSNNYSSGAPNPSSGGFNLSHQNPFAPAGMSQGYPIPMPVPSRFQNQITNVVSNAAPAASVLPGNLPPSASRFENEAPRSSAGPVNDSCLECSWYRVREPPSPSSSIMSLDFEDLYRQVDDYPDYGRRSSRNPQSPSCARCNCSRGHFNRY